MVSYSHDRIFIEGARENNLKNINVEIPKNKLVVITGVSGSGKSSLAFDTIFAEGYRRYVENLSSYAKYFLKSAKKPKVKSIKNLSPAIAIDQKAHFRNPRSTVGTITDIYDYVRVLYSGFGRPYCSECKVEMKKQDPEELLGQIKKFPKGTQLAILAVWEKESDDLRKKLMSIESLGYASVRIGGKFYKISDALALAKLNDSELVGQTKFEVVVDRLILNSKRFDRERILDSLICAEKISKVPVKVLVDNQEKLIFSRMYNCPKCGKKIKNLTAKNFSFNSPEGACSKCSGLGKVALVSSKKIVPNPKLSILEGAILPLGKNGMTLRPDSYFGKIFLALAKRYRFSLDKPFSEISGENAKVIFFGSKKAIEIAEPNGKKKELIWEGVVPILENKYEKLDSFWAKNEIERYMTEKTCPDCSGRRLKENFLNVKIMGIAIDQFVSMEIDKLLDFLKKNNRSPLGLADKSENSKAARNLMGEIIKRLLPLSEVGLGYLNLDRSCATLSGGEFQRTRLATQLYSGLGGVIYVLDEPSVGLHSRDNKKLIDTLQKIKNDNNSVLVVEHDREIMLCADHVIDLGPGAGKYGGEIIFQGNVSKLKKANTQTAQYLSGSKKFRKTGQRPSLKQFIEIVGAAENNLKNVTVKIPLGKLVSVAGVSGSGKSSLINDILARELRRKIMKSLDQPGRHKKITVKGNISKMVIVDQSPIGRTPRSNAATYTGVFNLIREQFAQTEVAKTKGLDAGHFSFNMRGGRCEYCQGEGVKKIEMHLLEDVYSICGHCNGTRYSKKVLDIQYHGKNIAQVLDMDVEFASHFFSFDRAIKEKLDALCDVGLGYLRLGQCSTELSGGEAQRIKLAAELCRKSIGSTLYVLDEPTVGLHFEDVDRLLNILDGLVEKGNSVIVVEHNLDVISSSDYVIELGPDGGSEGGKIVFEGYPEKLAKANTWTGKALAGKLK